MQMINALGTAAIEPQQNYFLVMLKNRWMWLQTSIRYTMVVLLFIISCIISVVVIRNNKRQKLKGLWWSILLAIAGILFVMLPTNHVSIRFGVGYFIIMPCIFVGIVLKNNYSKIIDSFCSAFRNRKIYIFITVLLLIQ